MLSISLGSDAQAATPHQNEKALLGAGANFRVMKQGKTHTNKSDAILAHLKTIHKGCIHR